MFIKNKVYKNKNDIPYFKFLEFSNIIESQSEQFIIAETRRIFRPVSINDFSKALETPAPFRPNFKLDLDFKTAGKFIDADTYFSDQDYMSFFKLVLKRKYFFKNVNFENISLQEAEYILSKFSELKNDLRQSYEYLYNPPIRNVGKEMTPGGLEREAFSEHYGAYIEMIYILCKGDFTKFEEITSWDLHRFLFQAEYLIRKRGVENLK
jgi:hypothetical protein